MPITGSIYLLWAIGLVIGLFTGCVGVAFHICLDYSEQLRRDFMTWAAHYGIYGSAISFAGVFLAIATSGLLVKTIAPETAGSGIPHLKTLLLAKSKCRWIRIVVIKFLSTVVGVAGGLVLGRGGPTIHMGGAIGHGFSHLVSSRYSNWRALLTTAGAAAGLSAAFNTPLAGVIFVMEEFEWRYRSTEILTVALACLGADWITREVLGQEPAFGLRELAGFDLSLTWACIPLGLFASAAGLFFNSSLVWGQRLANLESWPLWVWWILLTLLVLGGAAVSPSLLGSGEPLAEQVLGHPGLTALSAFAFLAVRFVLTIGSSSAGVAGGIFIPVLVLGALLGRDYSTLLDAAISPNLGDPHVFAAIGMAALFTAIVHAPLTGIILVIEMTGSYALVLPLFVACSVALMCAQAAKGLPIYRALAPNQLRSENRKGS